MKLPSEKITDMVKRELKHIQIELSEEDIKAEVYYEIGVLDRGKLYFDSNNEEDLKMCVENVVNKIRKSEVF